MVDQLLLKTRTEMHVTLPSGSSPKHAHGPNSTSQLKSPSDGGQNSGNSFSSQARGKKRERGDHGVDPVKRERPSSRSDDSSSVQCKSESSLKKEIARITEKGAVIDLEGVDKLVQLMQLDGMDRKIDLSSRSMLVSVMASTEKVDCLNRFMQLKGVPLLDAWLQDIQKGKVGDSSSPKDGNNSVEEFLLLLLRALDKLPVNLHALQMCNIGRSVNHLRSHKNVEIQRKARTLVDTWKKRVEAEMNMIDSKSSSTQATAAWPSKSSLPEASHGEGKTPSASDIAMKSSPSQNSATKSNSVRSSHGESILKHETLSPGAVKPTTTIASGKGRQPNISVGGTANASHIKEDRSSSSTQSHSNGHSISGKDDTRSFSSGSVTVNKTSRSSKRNKKISGSPRRSASGSQKENNSSKILSAHKNSALEKLSHAPLTNVRAVEGPTSEGNHRLIVKIPNRVKSPAQGVNGRSLGDPTLMSSRASSPVLLSKSKQSDPDSKDKSDTHHCIVDSSMGARENNDSKVELAESKCGGSPTLLPDQEQSMDIEDSKRESEGLLTKQVNSEKLLTSSFSPMNALVESCAKYSEAVSSSSLEDDVGMNLLASVAAGEISRSDGVSPADSVERTVHAVEEVCASDEAKSMPTPEEGSSVVQKQLNGESGYDGKKQIFAPLESSGDRKCAASHSPEDTDAGEQVKEIGSTSIDLKCSADHDLKTTGKPNEKTDTSSSAVPLSVEWRQNGESNEGVYKEKADINDDSNRYLNCQSGRAGVLLTEEKDGDHLRVDECKPLVEVARSEPFDQGACTKVVNEELNRTTNTEQKLTAPNVKPEMADTSNCEELGQVDCVHISVPEPDDAEKVGELNDGVANSCLSKSVRLNMDKEVGSDLLDQSHSTTDLCSSSHDPNNNIEANTEKLVIPNNIIAAPESRSSGGAEHEAQEEAELTESKSVSILPDEADKYAFSCSGAASPSSAGRTDPGAKLKFDLNEGFSSDDGKYGESVTSTSSFPTAVQGISPLPSSVKSSHSASITVAAAAKGPFVPPEDLLRSKVELGWKGSAATSAFRPAEPRKVRETSSSPRNLSPHDALTRKHERVALDIDLNVPDERVLEEMISQDFALAIDSVTDSASKRVVLLNEPSDSPRVHGCGLDLDLNRVGDANDAEHCTTSSNPKVEASSLHVKQFDSLHARGDFDLNNGPVGDDRNADEFPYFNQLVRGGMSQLPSGGPRTSSSAMNNFSSWFPPGNSYSTVAIPSMLPERGEPPFSVFPTGGSLKTIGPAGVAPFNREVFRGSVLSSSPAAPYPSSPFQLPVFPYGTSIPLPSATFSVGAASYGDFSSAARPFSSPVNPQYLGPVGSVTSQFQRPYMVTFPDIGNNSILESNRQWSRQGFDLNTGPGPVESEVREEMLPPLQGLTEEQARMFSVSGGILKRKEPDGGWENETFRRKPSWQ